MDMLRLTLAVVLFALVQGDRYLRYINYKYYEQEIESLDDLDHGAVVSSGQRNDFSIQDVAQQGQKFAIVFDTIFEVPETGDFTFRTRSNDGSRVYINGQLVVDNDGVHGAQNAEGTIHLNKVGPIGGFHSVKVEYFQYKSGALLFFFWKGPLGFSGFELLPGHTFLPGLAQGHVHYTYHQAPGGANWQSVHELSDANKITEGFRPDFSIHAVARRANKFGVIFDTQFEVQKAGWYKFFTKSNDGSKLWINGDEIVDNDGRGNNALKEGSVYLTVGKHSIKIAYFEWTGLAALHVFWSSADIEKEIIPSPFSFCPEPVCEWVPGAYFTGMVIYEGLTKPSPEKCELACVLDEACIHFNYWENENCELFSKVTGHGYRKGAIKGKCSGDGQIGGDPHFHTFDGLMHHFQGLSSVWYTAVQLAPITAGGKTVKIEMQTQGCGGDFQCLDAVRLLFDDVVVSNINTHGPVSRRVRDGYGVPLNSNVSNEYYNLTFENNNITHVVVNNGLQYWVRGMWMKVSVPVQFKNRVKGLLGTYNGDHTDDLTEQHGEAIVFDRQAVEQFIDAKASMPVQQFGHSWISRNMTGGLGHKFSTQAAADFSGALIVNYTSGAVSNSIKDQCQKLVMKALAEQCPSLTDMSRDVAEKLILACQYDLNVCPECVDMVVDGSTLHCH